MLLALALATTLNAAPAVDSLPGTWQISGDVAGNPVKITCTFRQAGTVVSGNCGDDTNPPLPVTGEVKEGKVTFSYIVDYQGQPLTIVYSGTFAAPMQLKGTIEVKPMGASGTFTGAPAPKKP
jgi:hypothetical protein